MAIVEFSFDPNKDIWLQAHRGIGFRDVIFWIESGVPLQIMEHPNPRKYPGQRLLLLEINEYCLVVPFAESGGTYTLKTIYPSRKMTRRHKQSSRGDSHA